MKTIIEDVKKMLVSERMELVGDIWDSIAAESPDSLKLSASETDELKRRYAAHQADPSTGIPWAEVRAKLFFYSMDLDKKQKRRL